MTNLAKGVPRASGRALRAAPAGRSRRAQVSADGTRKWLMRFDDGQEVETVHIPEADRGTLCVSSPGRLHADLHLLPYRHPAPGAQSRRAAEIVGQVMVARDALGEWPSPKEDRQLTNIVLMGMGEPLYNFDNVAAAMKIVMDPEGLAISRRKITLSTSRRGADDRALRRRARGQSRDIAARRDRRAARRARAAQPQIPDRRAARGLPRLSRARATRGASPSST